MNKKQLQLELELKFEDLFMNKFYKNIQNLLDSFQQDINSKLLKEPELYNFPDFTGNILSVSDIETYEKLLSSYKNALSFYLVEHEAYVVEMEKLSIYFEILCSVTKDFIIKYFRVKELVGNDSVYQNLIKKVESNLDHSLTYYTFNTYFFDFYHKIDDSVSIFR